MQQRKYNKQNTHKLSKQ